MNSEEQRIAAAISDSLADADPSAAISGLFSPGVEAPSFAPEEVRLVEAAEGGVLIWTQSAGSADGVIRPERWHALRVEHGKITDVAAFDLRQDAIGHLGYII
jgi:hypothetical protein